MERYNRNGQTSCWSCYGRYDPLGETKWRDMTCVRNPSWWISSRSSDRGGKIKIIMEFIVGDLMNFWSFCQTSLLLSSIKCQMSRQYPDEQQYVWCVVNLNRKFHACVWFFLTFSNFPTLAPSWQVTLISRWDQPVSQRAQHVVDHLHTKYFLLPMTHVRIIDTINHFVLLCNRWMTS